MIRVFLVDDHAMFLEGLCVHLRSVPDIEVCGQATSGEEALAALATCACDVVLLDIRLPGADGLAVLPAIKSGSPARKVMMLSMFEHPLYLRQALERGADGYMLKGGTFRELEQAVRTVHSGQQYISEEFAAGDRSDLLGTLRDVDLSDREFEAVRHLTQGLELKQIASEMGDVSVNAVSTYLGRAMKKMGVDNRTDLIRFAIEAGLVE